MEPNKKTARIAGLLYLIVVLSGIFNLMYVPSKLVVRGDAATTFQNISNSETLFRLGIVSAIICYIAFLLLPLVLYQLLKSVNKTHAQLMVAFAVVSVPISLVNLFNKFSILTLISDASYLKTFDISHLQTQVSLYLNYSSNGNQLASVFWGLWLFPLGYLIFKSGLLPKILGIFLMLGCFGYLINFTGNFLFPGYSATNISTWVSLPASISEIGTCLWLLVVGIKNKTA